LKVYPEKLAAQLENSISPIYVISGDEPLLVQESADLVRSGLRKQGYTERSVHHIEGSFNWETVLFDANSMSLFSDKKLLELRLPTGKPGDKGGKMLRSYAENPPEDNILLLITGKLDASTQRSRWFSTLEKTGVSVQIWPIEPAQLPVWIQRRAGSVGLALDADSAQALADKVEGNLLAAVQEIELLRLIAGDGSVTLEQVIEGVSDSTRYNVFSLLDTALSGNRKKTIQMVQGLQTEGAEILPLLGLLARELRALLSMAGKVRAGARVDAVMSAQRVWQKRKKVVGYALSNHSVIEFEQMLVQAGKVDQMVKGLQPGEPWDELASLVIRLSGVSLSTWHRKVM
jgi:DNA polymerase-3 subunit delta